MTSGLRRAPARRARRLLTQFRLRRVRLALAAQQRPIEECGLGVGLRLEVAPKRVPQLVVLRQRLLAATVPDEQPHQRAVRSFVQRVDHQNLFERFDGTRRVPALGPTGGKLE